MRIFSKPIMIATETSGKDWLKIKSHHFPGTGVDAFDEIIGLTGFV